MQQYMRFTVLLILVAVQQVFPAPVHGHRGDADQGDIGNTTTCSKEVARDHMFLQVGVDRVQHGASKVLASRISLDGRQLLIDGKAFHMKGINWNPVGWGHNQSDNHGIEFARFVQQDADLMAGAGINVLRTYGPLTDIGVLDALWDHGIWVMNTVFAYGLDDPDSAVRVVNAVKHHPAILMWVIGNEWNYNGIYAHLSFEESVRTIKKVADLVKQADQLHPVSSIYGNLPSEATLNELSNIDVWGLNVYRGLSFGNTFNDWRQRSGKPMYMGEYGADAFNTRIAREDQRAQADATTALTNEIVQHSSTQGGACLGGLLFEFADEWWKDGDGSPDEHDEHGSAPGGGPHPDWTFNEEWWGIVDITRAPRLAYDAYKNTYNPGYSGSPVSAPTPTPTPASAPRCVPGQTSRRRRAVELCSCRRRHASEDKELLSRGWRCEGPSIVSTR